MDSRVEVASPSAAGAESFGDVVHLVVVAVEAGGC